MLIYRLVSWIFIAAIGWVVFFFVFRTEKDVDPDAPISDAADPSGPADRRQTETRPIGAAHADQNPHRRRSSGHARSTGARRDDL